MKTMQRLAGLTAVAALFVYALSCRPSWSPDSKKVSFTYVCNVKEESCAVAVHELDTGVTKKVFSFSEDSGIYYPHTFWKGNKLSILAAMKIESVSDKEKKSFVGKKKQALLMTLDPETRAFDTIRTLNLGGKEEISVMPPVLDDAGNIWFTPEEKAEFALCKITPAGTEVVHVGDPLPAVLAQGGGRIYYLRETMRTGGDRLDGGDEKGMTDVTMGLFRADEERFDQPMIVCRVNEFHPLLAVSPDGKNVCFCYSMGGEGVSFLCFLTGSSKGRPKLPVKVKRLGGLCFSLNSETVWIVYLPEKTGATDPLPVLSQIHPVKGVLRTRELPFDRDTKRNEDLVVALQPAPSPDGRWIAISTTVYEEDAPGRLLLVDLESKDLDIRTVLPPID